MQAPNTATEFKKTIAAPEPEAWSPPDFGDQRRTRIGASVVEQFVAGHDASDVLRELVQNEFDGGGDRLTVTFSEDSLDVMVNGRGIGADGWTRLSVIVGAITPCGQCLACLDGHQAQCGGSTPQGYAQALGGWRFGNTIDGCQAEYVRVPFAMANLTPVPEGAHRRAGPDVPGHHEHRFRRRRERSDQDR